MAYYFCNKKIFTFVLLFIKLCFHFTTVYCQERKISRPPEFQNGLRRIFLSIALGVLTGMIGSLLFALVVRSFVRYLNRTPILKGPVLFSPEIAPKTLQSALSNENRLLGSSPSGKYYRTVLDNGLAIAVKRLEPFQTGSPERKSLKRKIQKELETLASLRHRNLMSLRAYVREPGGFSLVYDYVPTGSLEDAMNRVRDNQLQLSWEVRLRIAVGVVKGLQYLHFERKAIAPVSPGVKSPPHSALFPSMQKFRNHKSFLAAAVEGDRKSYGGSRTGKLAMPIQNSITSDLAPKSRLISQKSQSLDLRDRGAGKVSTVPEAEVTLELQDDALKIADSPLSLEVSFHLVRGLNGKWDIKSSNIKEVGCSGVGPLKDGINPNSIPKAPPLNPTLVPKLKPKPSLVWQPKRTACKELSHRTTTYCPSRETHSPGLVSPGVSSFQSSACPSTLPLRSSVVANAAASHSLLSDKSVEAWFESPATTDSNLLADVAESELLGSDESEEARNGSACSTVLDESLVLDPRLVLQEHSGNFDKIWGNSEQWVLELRDGRRVAVPVQIALPPCEDTEVLEKQQQLVTLELPEVSNMSLSLFEEDDVLVEDWASESFSEEANQPLVVDPIAFSLPLAKEKQSPVDEDSVVGVNTSSSQEPYSDWFQKRFNNFDSFLGTSIVGLEDQATDFLLAVEAELYRRAEVNKKSCGSKGSGVKGLRELKGLFSSINYGSSSARRCGINRNRVLSVAQ